MMELDASRGGGDAGMMQFCALRETGIPLSMRDDDMHRQLFVLPDLTVIEQHIPFAESMRTINCN